MCLSVVSFVPVLQGQSLAMALPGLHRSLLKVALIITMQVSTLTFGHGLT